MMDTLMKKGEQFLYIYSPKGKDPELRCPGKVSITGRVRWQM